MNRDVIHVLDCDGEIIMFLVLGDGGALFEDIEAYRYNLNQPVDGSEDWLRISYYNYLTPIDIQVITNLKMLNEILENA